MKRSNWIALEDAFSLTTIKTIKQSISDNSKILLLKNKIDAIFILFFSFVIFKSNIRLMPVGLSKPVKKLVQERLPDLSNFQDISEFIEK